MFLSGRGASRRVETLLEVQGLDASGDYVLRPLGRPSCRACESGSKHHAVLSSPADPEPLPGRGAVGGLIALIDAPQRRIAAGSGMPWEAPLQRILESIEGPVAKVSAVVIIILTGLSLAFGDMGGGIRRLVQIVFGLSIAFAATSFFLTFFSFAGGALID